MLDNHFDQSSALLDGRSGFFNRECEGKRTMSEGPRTRNREGEGGAARIADASNARGRARGEKPPAGAANARSCAGHPAKPEYWKIAAAKSIIKFEYLPPQDISGHAARHPASGSLLDKCMRAPCEGLMLQLRAWPDVRRHAQACLGSRAEQEWRHDRISPEPPRTPRATEERPVPCAGCADAEGMSFFFQNDVVFVENMTLASVDPMAVSMQ